MPKAPEPFSTCQKTTKSLPRISPKSYCYNAVPNRFLAHFSTSRTNGPRSLSRAKAGTHSPSPTGSHTAAYTAKQGRFRWGRYYYPRTVSHVSETLRGQGVERQTLPLLGLGRVCSRRTQKAFGAAMRLCASLLRGVAAPLGCVICLQLGDVAVFSLCAQYFLNVRGGGGITTPGVLCVLPKRRTSACQSGSFVVFCGRTAIIDSSGVKFDPTHNLENFKIILIFLITCGMVVLLEIKPLHRSYYVGKL